MMKRPFHITMLLFLLGAVSMFGQSAEVSEQEHTADSTGVRLFSDLQYMGEVSGSFGGGDYAPFWIHSNRHGLSSVEPNSGYLRGAIWRDVRSDSLYRWRHGYGLDVAVGANFTSKLIIHQAYYDLEWLHGRLSIGAKEHSLAFKNDALSSGSQTLGINARPIPQVRLELPEYWTLPILGGWIQMKGHIAYGMMYDNSWQHDFTGKNQQYTDNAFYHSKAGYLRIQHDDYDYPLSFEAGLEMACVFGGNTYNHPQYATIKNRKGFKSFFNAFIPGGGDSYEKGSVYENSEGNQLGSYLLRLNYDKHTWRTSLYFERFFEDQSGMFGIDYDGYGEGAEWDSHKERKYLLYDFKDMLLGWELELKTGSWLKNIVLEYLYTKYQSGPIYHDHNSGLSDHIGGIDEYYNHYIYPGWQHWGEAIGNPLFYSPLYNKDGSLRFKNNRFMAFHLGLSGEPIPGLTYRLLGTWEEGFGTYRHPFPKRKHQLSFLAEATYSPMCKSLKGWSGTIGIGLDHGDKEYMLGNNFGVNLKIAKRGWLTAGKRVKSEE